MRFYLDTLKFNLLEEFVYPGEILAFILRKFIKIYFEEAPKDLSIFGDARVERAEGDTLTFVVAKENAPKLISIAIDKFNILDIDIVTVPLEEMIEDIFRKSSNISTLA